jgi:hypothetical protein
MPVFPRSHIDSAVVCVSVCICRGRAECVWAQGHMLHADNHVFGGQLCVLVFFDSGEWAVAPRPPLPALIWTARQCMYSCFCICCGGAERVRAQGRMLHVDNCILVGSSVLLLLFVCEGHRVFAPRVTHARLLPSPYRTCRSACVSLYLLR